MIFLDENEISFPNPEFYNPENGLIASGGDLSPKRLILAYENGIFPWYNEGEEILWWCPNERFVLFPKDLKISKSMRKILKDQVFQFTENKCFEDVMRNCRKIERKDQEGTWISEELVKSFVILNKIGIAKSFEVWQNNKLVGGFYGVDMGNVFCGESMFSKVSNASKAGFINFVLQHKNYELIDCQIHTTHLESLGATTILKKKFLKIIKNEKS